MSSRGRAVVVLAALAAALTAPAAASAHAYIVRTAPSPSATVASPPAQVSLTYSEPIEPRFAIVSVTDAAGHQQTAAPPRRAATDSHTLVVPLRRTVEGWYLVFWRVISADGHPVRGAFTYAVGTNPGPAPQFVIPSTSETAATPRLVVARWITFLAVMVALGLFALRVVIARPVARRVPGTSLRPLSVALAVALVVALVATPVYVVLSTAQFALRSAFALGDLLPLMRDSSFGRGFLDLELILALFALAAAVAIAVDRPVRPRRSIAELLALAGAAGAGGAALLVPGIAGHAAQTSPRGLTLPLDWLHLAAGSIWLGGLVGLLVLFFSLSPGRRVPALAVVVPRFSRTAFVSVVVLVSSGIAASVVHLPTLASLWQTSYGQAIMVKVAILLVTATLGAVNMLWTTPRLASAAAASSLRASARSLLRRLVSAEVTLVAGAVLAAAVLSSLPPPPKALASIGTVAAHVGPGPVTRVVRRGAYRVEVRVTPNRAAVPNAFEVRVTREGKPVRSAQVTVTFTMLDMEMGRLAYRLPERSPGRYARSEPALVMVGRWGLSFQIEPRGRAPITVLLVDRTRG
jgi:copper transport protein